MAKKVKGKKEDGLFLRKGNTITHVLAVILQKRRGKAKKIFIPVEQGGKAEMK